MYCVSCGNQLAAELNYCNRCGAKISAGGAQCGGEARGRTGSGPGAIVYIACAGLIGFIVVLRILMKSGASESALVGISFVYMAALFGICYLVMNTAKKSAGTVGEPETARVSGSYETGELGHGAAHQLSAAQTPAASVTEYTTRHLEEIPAREKKF